MFFKCLLFVEFVVIYIMVLIVLNVFFDFVLLDLFLGYIDVICKEIFQVLREGNGYWMKDSLVNFYFIDSVIKESMCVSYFVRCLIYRKVIVFEGVMNLIEGWYVFEGLFFILDFVGVYFDLEVFFEFEKYDVFWFVKLREQFDLKNFEEVMKIKRLGMVIMSLEYLIFSYGRYVWYVFYFVVIMYWYVLIFRIVLGGFLLCMS